MENGISPLSSKNKEYRMAKIKITVPDTILRPYCLLHSVHLQKLTQILSQILSRIDLYPERRFEKRKPTSSSVRASRQHPAVDSADVYGGLRGGGFSDAIRRRRRRGRFHQACRCLQRREESSSEIRRGWSRKSLAQTLSKGNIC